MGILLRNNIRAYQEGKAIDNTVINKNSPILLPAAEVKEKATGRGRYLLDYEKEHPYIPYKSDNEFINKFQPEKKQALNLMKYNEWKRKRDNYADVMMIAEDRLNKLHDYEQKKASGNLKWWDKKVSGVNMTSKQREELIKKQAQMQLAWKNKPIEEKIADVGLDIAANILPEIAVLKYAKDAVRTRKFIKGTDELNEIKNINKIDNDNLLFRQLFKKITKDNITFEDPEYLKNLEDLKYAKEYFSEFGYDIPKTKELIEIAKDPKKTDEVIKNLVNQHNTFVRGISTNWEKIEKKNPEILRYLEKHGIDYINNPKEAAEYMAIHVPPETGYGRFGLGNGIFRKKGIYTSNSIETAEGYTYGDGYIVKVKRPTDFSSKNRIDWINNNKLNYYESDTGEFPFWKKNKILRMATVKNNQEALREGKITLNRVLREIDGNNKDIDKIVDDLYKKVDEKNKDLINKVMKISDKAADLEKHPIVNHHKLKELDKTIDKIFDKVKKNTNIMEKNYLNKHYPGWEKIKNNYAHYVFIGKKGEKLLEPIESTHITPELWINRSRFHYGKYTKGLSTASLIPLFPYLNQQNNKNK